MFKHFKNIHSQHERGSIDNESWTAWSEHVLIYRSAGREDVVETTPR
jgi:hypothetical protein